MLFSNDVRPLENKCCSSFHDNEIDVAACGFWCNDNIYVCKENLFSKRVPIVRLSRNVALKVQKTFNSIFDSIQQKHARVEAIKRNQLPKLLFQNLKSFSLFSAIN